MNNEQQDREEEIFLRALELAPGGARAAWLKEACGGDAERRLSVEQLLAAHEEPASLLTDPESPDPDGLNEQSTIFGRPSANAERVGMTVGPFKLLEQLGEGGFGSVWAAEQKKPVRRRVALKFIKLGMDTKQVVARFEAERQALALTDHPNIAKILDAGTTPEGRLYFVMELVKGIAITDYCDRENLGIRSRLELFIKICQAIQHAHQKGIIHRDIKPSNVMVTLHDGVPVPKVIDFGIAKSTQQDLTEMTIYTQYHQFIGTPAYMSPEQAEMSGLDLDTRSDVYGLGVLLYELLTGATPFDQKELMRSGLDEMRKIIREREPTKPSTKLSQTRAAGKTAPPGGGPRPASLATDLDWIVMKCLEKDRTRRYETVNGLAEDIKRHLANEPIVARPPSGSYRVGKYIRRNRGLVASLAAIITVLTIGVVGMTLLLVEARSQKEIAETKGEEARVSSVKANTNAQLLREQAAGLKWQTYSANLGRAHYDQKEQQFGRCAAVLAACPEELRGWEWHWLNQLVARGELVVDEILDLKGAWFTPDGQIMTLSEGGLYKLWNRGGAGERIRIEVGNARRNPPTFSPNGSEVYLSGSSKSGRWDLATGEQLANYEEKSLWAFHVTPERILALMDDGRIYKRTDAGVESYRDLEPDDSNGFRAAARFSPDGASIAILKHATGDTNGKLEWNRTFLYETESGRRLADFNGVLLAFSSSSESLILAADTGLTYRSTSNGVEFDNIPWTGGRFGSGTVSRDGRHVFVGQPDGKLVSRDMGSGDLLGTLGGHRSQVFSVGVSPDDQEILSASEDGSVRIWPREASGESTLLSGQTTPIRKVAFVHDGKKLVSVGPGSTVRVWDATTGQELLKIDVGQHSAIDFSPEGHRIAVGSTEEGTVRIWDLVTGQAEEAIRELEGVNVLKYNPSGTRIAAAGKTGYIHIWDASSGEEKIRIPQDTDKCDDLAFAPDGSILAIAEKDTWTVRLHDANTGVLLQKLQSQTRGGYQTIAFNQDGKLVASVTNDLRVWEVDSGKWLHHLHTRGGTTLAFGRGQNGNRLFTGGIDGFLRIWEPHRGEELLAIPIPIGDIIWSIAVSPDGKSVAASDKDGFRIWESERPSLAVEKKRRKVSATRELVDGRLDQFVQHPQVGGEAPSYDDTRTQAVEAVSYDDTVTQVVEELSGDHTIDPAAKKLALELLQVRRGVRAEPKRAEEAP